MEDKIVQPQSVIQGIGYRSPLKSDVINNLQSTVVEDVHNLSNAVNSINSRLTQAILALQNDNQYLRRKVDALIRQQDYIEKISARNNYLVTRLVDFNSTEGIFFPNGLDDSRSAMLNAEFGEITLPPNFIENKFYVISISSNRVISPQDLVVDVRGTFDKGEGEGLVNYERGGLTTPGNAEWAFNGLNDKTWIRRIEFPVDSRVDQVECELSVTIPEGSSSKANTIEVVPFPNGSVDITELATATDLGNNFIRIPGFLPEDNCTARRFHFPPSTVDRIRIRLRQRNWVEENGKKVFYYGLQELGLKLIDYDKGYVSGATFGSNNSFILKLKAPENCLFNSITRFDPDPNFFLEDFNTRHVHMKVGINEDPSSGILWNSDIDLPPQDSNVNLITNVGTLYVFFELNFVDKSGGVLSPFSVGTTPFLKGLGLTCTMSEL